MEDVRPVEVAEGEEGQGELKAVEESRTLPSRRFGVMARGSAIVARANLIQVYTATYAPLGGCMFLAPLLPRLTPGATAFCPLRGLQFENSCRTVYI